MLFFSSIVRIDMKLRGSNLHAFILDGENQCSTPMKCVKLRCSIMAVWISIFAIRVGRTSEPVREIHCMMEDRILITLDAHLRASNSHVAISSHFFGCGEKL